MRGLTPEIDEIPSGSPGSLDDPMDIPATSMSSKDNNFWKWHSTIKAKCQLKRDKADAENFSPAANASISKNTFTHFEFTFTKFVSDATYLTTRTNTAGIHDDKFTVNGHDLKKEWFEYGQLGIAARKCKLKIPPPTGTTSTAAIPLIIGENTIKFNGTDGVNAFTIIFTITN